MVTNMAAAVAALMLTETAWAGAPPHAQRAKGALSAIDQIHVSMEPAGDARMVVTFVADQLSTDVRVEWGWKSELLGFHTSPNPGYSYNYTREDGVFYKSPFIYKAFLDAVPAGAEVFYRIVDGGLLVETDIYSFKRPPAPGDHHVKLAIIGDLGQTSDSNSTIQHVLKGTKDTDTAFDALVIAGDLSYADSENSPLKCHHPGGCTQERWDSFGRLFQPLSASIPVMSLPGNHEIEVSSAPLDGSARPMQSRNRRAPTTTTPFLAFTQRYGNNAPNQLHYSWNAGPLHCVFINSYDEYVNPDTWNSATGPQYQWLEDDLKNVNRSITPWIAAFTHAPWYNSDQSHQNEKEPTELKALMEPLLHKYNVDILFAGHVHAYERSKPVYQGAVTEGAMIEINIGDGGNREGPADRYLPQPDWSALRYPVFGHGGFEVYNSTHARFTWHRNDQQESQVADDVWLVKNVAVNNLHVHGVTVYDAEEGALGTEWDRHRQVDKAPYTKI